MMLAKPPQKKPPIVVGIRVRYRPGVYRVVRLWRSKGPFGNKVVTERN